jgi:hypothetical protein
MTDIERKVSFYLGKEYDLAQGAVIDDAHVMYDARDLTTHAVCIGMTGSGKTGLGVTMLEEAALDGIPSIIIDPKGDMTNLLLTFPDLLPQDFEPWVNPDDARRKDQTPAEFAAATAEQWRKGIASWGQDGERIRRLKEAAEFAIYTPGSDAGLPVSVLQTFAAPHLSWDDDSETLREMISGTVSGLLALVGIAADPVQSREHILLSSIFEHAWRQGQDLDIAILIGHIQSPPMAKMGVFDMDTFYPAKDRFQLAMALNRLVAAPSFQNWISGAPLDIAQIIQTPAGKPRVAIFYIAHLSDAERMFFVSLLLQQIIGWMRALSGTTSLRCLVYFDELFGYFPPHPLNPPTKMPLLTLLKMARAYGVGMMLATQNPVDLDYKGLTNAGTWFVGKLQTDRDKARVLEGMEGVISESGTMLDRQYLDRLISSLGSRIFILHNVHAKQPILYSTRWALSYLRGPLTRSQVRDLMADRKAGATAPAVAPAGAGAARAPEALTQAAMVSGPRAPAAATPTAQGPAGYTPVQPMINARVPQFFLPVDLSEQRAVQRFAESYRGRPLVKSTAVVYEPYFVALASVLYADTRRAQTQQEELGYMAPLPASHGFVDWDSSLLPELSPRDLSGSARPGTLFNLLPSGMSDSPPYTKMRDELIDTIFRAHSIALYVNEQLKLTSDIGETREAFIARCQRESRDQLRATEEKERVRLTKAIEQLEQKLRREEQELEQDKLALNGRRGEELISGAESVIGMLMGRRRTTAVSAAARKRRMTAQAKAGVRESEEEIARLQREIETLKQKREEALADLRATWEGAAERVTEQPLRPRKTDIRVSAYGLAWRPFWAITYEDERGTIRDEFVPAYGAEPSEGAGRA